MMQTMWSLIALVATLGALACVVLVNWSWYKSLTAHLDLAKPWWVFFRLPNGVGQINIVSVYPRGSHYRAAYGDVVVKGNTAHRAVMNLVHKLKWDVYSICNPNQKT